MLVGAVLVLPGVAVAHGGGSYTSAGATSSPTVDGVVGAGEWEAATAYTVPFGSFGPEGLPATAKVQFMHTDTDLYVGVVVDDAEVVVEPLFSVYFDNAHNGLKDVGDDLWNAYQNAGVDGADDFRYNGAGYSADSSNETTGSFSVTNGDAHFEIKHPLCTDSSEDICWSLGQDFGVNFQYDRRPWWAFAPGPLTSDPETTNWADLAFGSLPEDPPPIVSGTNLLTNAGAEAGDGSTASAGTIVPIPDWTTTSSFTVVAYGTGDFPNAAESTRIAGGVNFFAGGPGGAVSTALQTVDVARAAPEIDAGRANATIAAHIGGFSTQADNGTVAAIYRDTGGVELGRQTIGPVTPADRGSQTRLEPRTASGDVPAGTRSIEVVMTATRASGTSNDGYFDNLSLSLDYSQDPVDTTPPTVRVTQPEAGTVVSGTIPVAAEASDNVGVTRVEFRYFDGSLPYHELGTDTVAPYTATFDSTLFPDTVRLGATLYAFAYDAAGNETGWGNGFTIDNVAPGTVTGATISISGQLTAMAGAASAPISGIPVDAIRGPADDGPSATPLAAIPLAAIPLAAIPLAAIPLAAIPLAAIGFNETNLDQNGLGGVPLSSIPLDSTTDTWQARLNANPAFAGRPVQSVTLGEVMGTSVVTSPTPVALDDLDLAASPLAAIPLAAIALGAVPLAAIPLDGGTPADNLADWCEYINTQPGFTCTDPNTLATQTMVGLGLQGVPLAAIPLAAIPLAAIDLAGSPLAAIPLAAIDLVGSPLAAIPLAAIDFASSPLAAIPLAAISPAAEGEILNCPTGGFACADSDTLGGASTAGAVKADATVQDIGYYCRPGTPADAECSAGHTPIMLADFVDGLPADVTLADLLASIISEAAYDWETLPLPGFPIQDFSEDGGTITYVVSFSLTGPGEGSFPATVSVKIPAGSRYAAGSTIVREGLSASEPTLSPDGELVWNVSGFSLNSVETLTFRVKSPLLLETATATGEITAAGLAEPVETKSPARTTIRQTWEFFEGTPSVTRDTLYFGYTANGDDQDRFRLSVPPAGTQVTVRLSHLGLDGDLVVYGDVPPPLRTPEPATTALQAGDVGPSLQQRTQSITPEVLGDVPLNPPEGDEVLGISDNRGLADEEVTFIVPEDSDGSITIQISSFDGAYSNQPWMLRIEESEPIELPAGCKVPPLGTLGTTPAMPALLNDGSTLYLFNAERYGNLYGPTAQASTWSKLEAMAARTDAARGTVIPIDAITTHGVADALAGWEADPCSPGRTNDAVRALGSYLDTIPSSYKYIVLVGDWTVIPTGLVLDNTLFANERSYASTFYGTENNQYLSSYALGYLPTDDPYGDTSYSGFGPYVPEVAVGRLVEKPSQIDAQLDQYMSPERNGAIDPATALVTGYDFLQDGARAISTGLEANVSAPSTLINDVWSKSDLMAAMFPASNPPIINSINAHYDHYRALPADESAAGTESILFTTADLAANPTPGRLVITIGCHSGVPVSDFLVSDPLRPDWDQTYAAQGAIGYIAQSGFGLGETAGVAYSEKLHALLAERLNGSLTVGQALVFAKQEYSAMPLQGGYDVKVIDGSGLYGLPMYRVGTGTITPPPAPLPLETDAATGLQAASFDLSPTFTRVNASTGSYFTVGGNASFQNRRPIEPFAKLDVTQPGLVAHGALLTGAVSSDQPNFDAAFSRAIEDSAALSPELVGDATSPTRLQSIATFSTPAGPQQRLVVSTGQFLADGVPDAEGIGTQRLFSSLRGVVLYAPASATDFSSPTFGPVQAFASSPTTIGFAVDVEDADEADTVKRVLALYKDASGAWRSVDLAHAAGSTRWSGGGAFTGTTAEWFLQAVDRYGNVGVISNKAHIDPVILPDPTGGISATVAGQQTNGWFTGDATVTIDGPAPITSSLDGGPFQPKAVVTVSGTGLHTVDYQGGGGARGTTIVPIDVSDPTIAVKAGIAQAEVGDALATTGLFTCTDAGSGIASCEASGIDTSTPTLNGATRTFTVTATDRVGRTSTATGEYRVIYAFRGFFQPVDNLPVVNSVKAGSAVPTKFSLGGNYGLSIFAAWYPKSGPVTCGVADAITDLEATVTAGSSSLSYDAATGRYHYVWKTEKTWAGSCRQLVIKLADGTTHRANFKFK